MPLDGWLHESAAYLTAFLLRAQEAADIDGCLLEVGVYAGKYLSVLYNGARGDDRRDAVIGVDTFQWIPEQTVLSNIERLFGTTDGLTLVRGRSQEWTAEPFLGDDGSRPRFISVDGDHSATGVVRDLELASSWLASKGLIAIDDFLNSRAIGVSEGAYRFFLSSLGAAFSPIAYCENKLLVSRRDDQRFYQALVWEFIESYPELSVSERFKRMHAEGLAWVEQDLLGSKILIL